MSLFLFIFVLPTLVIAVVGLLFLAALFNLMDARSAAATRRPAAEPQIVDTGAWVRTFLIAIVAVAALVAGWLASISNPV